jgi:hypothetical protein
MSAHPDMPGSHAFDSVNLVAFQTVFFAPVPKLTVFRLDAFPVWTGVFVVINLAMLRWIFRRVRMVWIYFCHV